MKTMDNFLYFKISEVIKLLGITRQTIRNWYHWKEAVLERGDLTAEEQRMVELLPPPITDWDGNGTQYFHCEDVEYLKKFQGSIRYGLLAEWNRTRWGSRNPKKK